VKKAKKDVDYYNSLFKAIYEYYDVYEAKLLAQKVRDTQDLYDKYHGKDGWEFNLLTGRLEKKKS